MPKASIPIGVWGPDEDTTGGGHKHKPQQTCGKRPHLEQGEGLLHNLLKDIPLLSHTSPHYIGAEGSFTSICQSSLPESFIYNFNEVCAS